MSKEIEALAELQKIRNYVAQLMYRDTNIPNISFLNRLCDFDKSVDIIEATLKRNNELESRLSNLQNAFDALSKSKETVMKELSLEIEKNKVLEIIKECVGLKMSVDEDIGCLYVPIIKCFRPLEQNIIIVGYVTGKDKIESLKEVLK